MTMQFNAICALPGPYGSCETKRPSHRVIGQDQPVYGNEQQNQELDLMASLRNWIVAFCLLFVFVPQNVAQNHWIGTWTASPQSAPRGQVGTFHNQTVRLIVHTSAGGKTVRIKISNTLGDQPLVIGAARIARRASEAEIDRASDRALKFHGNASITIGPHSMAVSDPVNLEVPAL
jgi:hypothetical protein